MASDSDRPERDTEPPTMPRTPSGLLAACKRTESGAFVMPETIGQALLEFWRARYDALADRMAAVEQRLDRVSAEPVRRHPKDPR